MGIMSFIKDAGQKLFGHADPTAAAQQAQAAPNNSELQAKVAEANQTAGAVIEAYIAAQGLGADALRVAFEGATQTALVSGQAADQATKDKILLCCGNVQGVAQVNDRMTVAEPADESQHHVVERGDTLSAIAKTCYGNAGQYPKIFEVNQPMLSHPDKIYPGQLLRIPA